MLTAIKFTKWFRIGIRVRRIAVCLFIVSVQSIGSSHSQLAAPAPSSTPFPLFRAFSAVSHLIYKCSSIVIPGKCGDTKAAAPNFKMAAFGGHWIRPFFFFGFVVPSFANGDPIRPQILQLLHSYHFHPKPSGKKMSVEFCGFVSGFRLAFCLFCSSGFLVLQAASLCVCVCVCLLPRPLAATLLACPSRSRHLPPRFSHLPPDAPVPVTLAVCSIIKELAWRLRGFIGLTIAIGFPRPRYLSAGLGISCTFWWIFQKR